MNEPAVVITGASSGIGRACALRMDRAGWRVFAGVRSDAAADALREAGSERLIPVRLDVTDEDSIASAVALVREQVGERGLHGLVNNAGVAKGGVLEFIDLDAVRQMLEINVVGVLAVTQPLIPLLRQARGRIVMMSSIAGRSATPIVGAYAASKHALEALTDALRVELHPWGIQVSAVEPGNVNTPIWDKALAEAERALAEMSPEARRLYGPLIELGIRKARKAAQGRGTPPEAVAEVVHHALTAAKPKTRYLVGRDAVIQYWVERLPDRIRDRIVLSQLPSWGGG